MESFDELEPAERELAESLKRLSPAAAGVDPVAAAFAAGGRRARRQARVWQGTTALAVALWGVGWMMSRDRAGKSDAPVAVMVEKDVEPAGEPLSDQSEFVLQNAVLARGLAGLPTSQHEAVKVLRIEDLL